MRRSSGFSHSRTNLQRLSKFALFLAFTVLSLLTTLFVEKVTFVSTTQSTSPASDRSSYANYNPKLARLKLKGDLKFFNGRVIDVHEVTDPLPHNPVDPELYAQFMSLRKSMKSSTPIGLYQKDENTPQLPVIERSQSQENSTESEFLNKYRNCNPLARISCAPAPTQASNGADTSPSSLTHQRILCNNKNSNETSFYPLIPHPPQNTSPLSLSPTNITSLTCPHTLFHHPHIVFIRIQKTGSKLILLHLSALVDAVSIDSPIEDVPRYCYSGNRGLFRETCARLLQGRVRKVNESRGRLRCLKNHGDYMDLVGTFVRNGMDVAAVTFLRDPVRRVVSEYKHLSGTNVSGWWDYKVVSYEPKCAEGLLRFMNHKANVKGMQNRQTKMVAGCGDDECSVVYEKGEDMLEKAKENLRGMFFFGISDMMDVSLKAMYLAFGYDVTIVAEADELKKRSLGGYNGKTLFQVNEELIKEIVAVNDLDVQLYTYAVDLFLEKHGHLL